MTNKKIYLFLILLYLDIWIHNFGPFFLKPIPLSRFIQQSSILFIFLLQAILIKKLFLHLHFLLVRFGHLIYFLFVLKFGHIIHWYDFFVLFYDLLLILLCIFKLFHYLISPDIGFFFLIKVYQLFSYLWSFWFLNWRLLSDFDFGNWCINIEIAWLQFNCVCSFFNFHRLTYFI